MKFYDTLALHSWYATAVIKRMLQLKLEALWSW